MLSETGLLWLGRVGKVLGLMGEMGVIRGWLELTLEAVHFLSQREALCLLELGKFQSVGVG